MSHEPLDPKKLNELASRPGTFPEMIQSTYNAGVDAGKAKEREVCDQETAGLHTDKRRIGWSVSLLAIAVLGFLLFLGSR
jgi:hypothetical protein